MGLDVYAKGLDYENSYHCGYITFNIYRKKLAKAFNPRLGELYEKTILGDKLTEKEIKEWNNLCNDDLDLFLWHSDCDGKFTPTECKKIYNIAKSLKVEMECHNYITMNTYNMHEQWLNIFKHCFKRRVNMYFE